MFKKFTCLIVLLLLATPAFSQITIYHEIPLYSNFQKDSLEIRTPLMKKNNWMTRWQNPDSFYIAAGINDTTLAYQMWPSTALELKLYNVDTLNIITMGGIIDGTTLTNYVVPICTTKIIHTDTNAALQVTDTISVIIPVDGTTRKDSTYHQAWLRYPKSVSRAAGALPVWDVYWVFKNPNASALHATYIKEGWVIRKRK